MNTATIILTILCIICVIVCWTVPVIFGVKWIRSKINF